MVPYKFHLGIYFILIVFKGIVKLYNTNAFPKSSTMQNVELFYFLNFSKKLWHF